MTDIDPGRVAELTERERARFAERLPRSIAFAKRASQSLAGGVACCARAGSVLRPAIGRGPWLWDLDGNAYVDLYNAYGVMVVGHAHPKVVDAVLARVALGTHFAMPVEDTVVVAELLAERFCPGQAVQELGFGGDDGRLRIMRAATGRDLVIKVEVLPRELRMACLSYWIDVDEAGPADRPIPVPNTAGVAEVYGRALRWWRPTTSGGGARPGRGRRPRGGRSSSRFR